MGEAGPQLRSQRLRMVNHQGDALRLGMNWTEEDLGKPQVLVDSAYGMGHPGTFHFRELVEEISNGLYEAGGKPGVFAVSDICDGVVQATDGMSYSPEALDGGPIGLVEDSDLIEINAPERRLAIVGVKGEHGPADEVDTILAERRSIWKPPRPRHDSGILSLYSRVARGTAEGASIT